MVKFFRLPKVCRAGNHGAYGVMAAQHTVDVLVRVRAPLGSHQTSEVYKTSEVSAEDRQITADNLKYFGEPVYEYDMAQGMEDGYLAACEVIQRDIFLDKKQQSEQETGVQRDDRRR